VCVWKKIRLNFACDLSEQVATNYVGGENGLRGAQTYLADDIKKRWHSIQEKKCFVPQSTIRRKPNWKKKNGYDTIHIIQENSSKHNPTEVWETHVFVVEELM